MPDPAGETLTIGSKSTMGVVHRTDSEIADANLSDVESEVASAEDFIVYGKASVEVFDDDTVSQKIKMDAFDEALDQFFAQGGNISYQHKDVMVGEALESHTLDSNVSVTIGDETKEFSAGDTLETKVEDDTLWLVAHIYGRSEDAGSDASVMTRLGAYRGDLDGFSVTIKNKEYENTANGQVIKEIDFHSVTVGTGDQIKNPDSMFGVAEFKLADYLSRRLTIDTKSMEMDILNKLRGASTEAIAEKTITHALSETYDLSESAKAVADEESVEDVQAKAEARLQDVQDKAEDREDLVALLADMTDLTSDEINQALDTMLDSDEEKADDEEADEEEEMEEEMEEEDEKADDEVEAHAEALADSMDVPVSRVMETLSTMEGDEEVESEEKADDEPAGLTEDEVEDLVDEKLEEAVESISETINEMESEVAETVSERVTEKLSTGSTPESDGADATEDGTRNLLDEW